MRKSTFGGSSEEAGWHKKPATLYPPINQALIVDGQRYPIRKEPKKMNQKRMFETEDLPLFSRTPVSATIAPFVPQVSSVQLSLDKCRFCFGTGMVGKLFCGSCEAGNALRRKGQ